MPQCACISANESGLLRGNHGSLSDKNAKVWRKADLCTQCASIDLNSIILSKGQQCQAQPSNYERQWLRSSRASTCPLCRFFATIASGHKNPLPDPDYEVRFLLGDYGPTSAFSDLLCYAGGYHALESGCRVVGVTNEDSEYYGSVADVAILPFLNIAPGEQAPIFHLRQIQSTSIDFTILREWIAYCKCHHAKTCEIFRGYPQHLPGLKVIDCETRTIIKASDGCEFAALSYVWGAKEVSKASNSGLLPRDVPMTISDAMQATLRLGLQYLWVDQYCIDQSNKDELQQQISIMDMIYNLAVVTLVAACGEDASFGLPGVGSKARIEQPTINLDGRLWISCTTMIASKIRKSKWFSRGWTYQEGLFSRRRLIFTEEQVYFECNNTRCQEIVAYDLHHLSDKMKWGSGGLFRGGFGLGYEHGLDDHIQAYTRRNLTYQEDAINAMHGVFRAFASMPSPIRNFWGIPTDFHQNALGGGSFWPINKAIIPKSHSSDKFPGYVDSIFARALCWHLDQPAPRREGFPSWSWAGWKGRLAENAPWGSMHRSFGDSEVKIWLQSKVGSYDRLSEPVIKSINQNDPSAINYTPILRIEAWVLEVNFEYFPDGLKDFTWRHDKKVLRPTYFTSTQVGNGDPSLEYRWICYWALILSAQVTVGDILHRELCGRKFQCIVLSKQASFGLVVKMSGDFADRIGHIILNYTSITSQGPYESLKSTAYKWYNLVDYFPCVKRRVLLR